MKYEAIFKVILDSKAQANANAREVKLRSMVEMVMSEWLLQNSQPFAKEILEKLEAIAKAP